MQRFLGLRRRVLMLAVCVVAGLLLSGCGGSDDEAQSNTSSDNSNMPLTPVEQPVNPSTSLAPSVNETQPLTGTPTEQLLGLSLPDSAGDSGKALGRPQSVELPAPQREALSRQLDVTAKALETGNPEAIINVVYPGRRDAVNDLLAHASTPMLQFAKALASGKLIAATDVMAEYEIVIDGKAYPVVFVSADDQWFLYAF